MIPTILSHQWKSFWRGRNAGKSLVMQLFMGFILLYLLASCFFFGIFLGHILENLFPHQDTTPIFCGLLLYYFLIDLAIRYLFQELPVVAIQPYMILDIRRRQLVRFLNIRSLFQFMNVMPVFIFIPYVITKIAPTYGTLAATALIAAILLLTVANHFNLLYIKRQSIRNAWWLPAFFGAIALLMTLDYYKILPLSHASSVFFLDLLRAPALALIPAALAILAFINNRRYLLRHLYLEELSASRKIRRSTEYTWLRQLGSRGELIALDLRLIFRNKRPRNLFIVALLTPIYGFTIFRPEFLHSGFNSMAFTGAFLITGSFTLNYGQFTFAWQSSHFDGLMTSGIDIKEFIRAKLMFYAIVSTVSTFLSTAYGFRDWHILPILGACWLYNIGFNSVLSVWLSTYRYKAVNLDTGMFENQGTTMATWINVLLVALAPLLFVYIFDWVHQSWIAIGLLCAIGLLSLLFRNNLIAAVAREFEKRKYLMLEGFREH